MRGRLIVTRVEENLMDESMRFFFVENYDILKKSKHNFMNKREREKMNFTKERLNISYVKLKFTLRILQSCILPENKVSALRGGMGEMLLQHNCIRDRQCRTCPFEEECVVHRILYTKMPRKPSFMKGEDSIGYLIECENYETKFEEKETLDFFLTLFGKSIVHFGQYLQAFCQLGMSGLGKEAAQYEICRIVNQNGTSVLERRQIDMENCCPETVYEYVMRRQKELQRYGFQQKVVFHTPLTLKFQGEYIQEFASEPIFAALSRRILMMDYFIENYIDAVDFKPCPHILEQRAWKRNVTRYSSVKKSRVELRGIAGYFYLEDMLEEHLLYLLAGELLHIGKNSSFGFGRYRVY